MNLAAGIHPDIPAEVYHADPCPEPSLSASIGWTLISRSPAHAQEEHPRLNPDFTPKGKEHYDIGHAWHNMVLRQKFWREEVVQIDAGSWQTKAAREKRDEAHAAGLVPILVGHYEALERMVGVLERHPQASRIFRDGTPEVTLVWQDDDTGIWLRCRPDWRPRRDSMPWPDAKTAADANPLAWDRRFAADHGGLLRAALYQEGIRRCCGIDSPTLYYVVQEKAPPHCIVIRVVDGKSAAMEIGRRMLHQAIQTWAQCIKSDAWPGYELVGELQVPRWMETKWLEEA